MGIGATTLWIKFMGSITLEKLITHLWKNRKSYNIQSVFDFPDYGGLSHRVYSSLSSEAVDAVQDCWRELVNGEFNTKANFKRAYVERLLCLGENIRKTKKVA